MGKRVRWQHPELIRRGIDQTRLVINNANGTPAAHDAFHFLVLGDSGTGRHRRHSPPRRIAERLLPHKKGAAFLLHTGDVVYLVGAADQYRDNFLKPYRSGSITVRIGKPSAMRGLSSTNPSFRFREITTTTTSPFPWHCLQVSPCHCGGICNGCMTSTPDGAAHGRVKPMPAHSLMFSPTSL